VDFARFLANQLASTVVYTDVTGNRRRESGTTMALPKRQYEPIQRAGHYAELRCLVRVFRVLVL
jgi:hypothetical protein